MTSIFSKLLTICDNEWDFFDRSVIRLDGTSKVGKRECDDGAWQRIDDYWNFIGGGYKQLTGKDRGTPWSAAFISWCMREAGAGKTPYSTGHAKYINQAIKNAKSGALTSEIVDHPLKRYPLKIGDLIGYWRGNKKITFNNAIKIGLYQSHVDIVIEVDYGFAFAIGGNVMHSVTTRGRKDRTKRRAYRQTRELVRGYREQYVVLLNAQLSSLAAIAIAWC